MHGAVRCGRRGKGGVKACTVSCLHDTGSKQICTWKSEYARMPCTCRVCNAVAGCTVFVLYSNDTCILRTPVLTTNNENATGDQGRSRRSYGACFKKDTTGAYDMRVYMYLLLRRLDHQA